MYVQDGTYLVMLVVVMIALVVAHRARAVSQALMALAIMLKLSPLAYVRNVARMAPATAALFVGILAAGLLLPDFLLENYLDIYSFHEGIKGNVYDTLAAIVLAVPSTLLLWYVEARLGFDEEERIGWSLVPFALFLAIKMRVARHLLIVLLVPDKKGARNIIAAVALALHAALPTVFRLGSVMYLTTVMLFITLAYYLSRIGWPTVRDDFRDPLRTLRLILHSR